MFNAYIAPVITMPDIAFVTLIRGECSTGVTCHIAKYPIKQDSINISINSIIILLDRALGKYS